MTVGTEVVHDLRGSGTVVFLDDWSVRIKFENGKEGVFDRENEYLSYANTGERVHPVPKYTPARQEKTTPEERNRRQSKYCTDFESNKATFGGDFNPDKNPQLLAQFEAQASTWVLCIGCGPESYQRVCEELRTHGLGDPENYVRKYPNGHAEKYDMLVPDPKIINIDFDLGLFFGYQRLISTGRYQIGRKEFALRNLLKVRILEIEEAVPNEN